jgi:hypothetical protein
VRYIVRTTLGFGLLVMCWVLFGSTIYNLLQIGTCASGGPYEVARPCPDGTGALGLMIPAAVILAFIGAGLYATRGKPPGSDNPPRAGLVITFFWTGIFWSIAVGCFFGVWGPEANAPPDAKVGGLIVGFLFVPMGAIGLFALKEGPGRRKKKGDAQLSTGEISVPPAPSLPGFGRAGKALRSRLPSEDPVDRLERLSRLRERGSLTGEEFEALKSRIVKEGR